MVAVMDDSGVCHRLLLARQLPSPTDRGYSSRGGCLRAGAEVFVVAGFVEGPSCDGSDGDADDDVGVIEGSGRGRPVGVRAVDQVAALPRLAVGERGDHSHRHRHRRL